ncbi:DNA-3-methyladenine glycosylase I [Demequina mangrovi]|uniref:DNA-3-methyladenine glycosylase I n=1 Tax=Demequina mangrovi TaxID=1043493 RepID=A0A1H7AMB0_9MICO|nr:DNA-3-methyladenine glycosylase I [Demequina mangrovi]SEJ66066.1 DNA-3-methyladenine glycosylase I [Demequina mangrovi]
MTAETNDAQAPAAVRCFGAGDALYERYHDEEWGIPVHGDAALLERIVLEGAQSGLSWLTILRKREGYREVFESFEPAAVATFTETDVERLMDDARIVRNRRKIESAIVNARATVALAEAGTSLDTLFWSFAPEPRDVAPGSWADVPASTPESIALAKALKKAGFVFVGPTTMYAAMQACGLVDDHIAGCVAAQR